MKTNDVIRTYLNQLILNNEIKPIEYKSKEIIFKEGSPCKYVCFILDGEVEISTLSYNGSQEVISLVGKNEFFGQYILFQPNSKYLGDVQAKGPVKLIKISKASLLEYLSKDKELLEAYIAIISNESFNIKQQVKLLSHKNALDRVIFYLDLISKNNICIIDSVSSLAKEVNLPRETVSRILSKLEKEKYLIKEKNIIHIL